MYKRFIKRLLDILIALLVLMVLSPLFLLAAIAVKLDSKGPVIFRQTRLGRDAKEFIVLKFFTVVVPKNNLILAA